MVALDRVDNGNSDYVSASKPVLIRIFVQNAEIRLCCYKGSVSVLSRTSETEKLYSSEEASMDSLENFSVLDTSMYLTHLAHISRHPPHFRLFPVSIPSWEMLC